MRLKSTELNTAFAILIAFGATQGCGEDPESTGEPVTGSTFGGSAPTVTGGVSALPTGGATGGLTQTTGGTTGGTKSGTGGASTGGSTGGTTTVKGGSGGGGTLGTGGGGRGSGGATGGRTGFGGQGGRSSGGGGSTAGGSGGGTSATTFASVATLIQNKCGSCHASSARMPVLKNDANLRTTLTTYKVSRCGNNPMVTPMDTAKSALVGVVSKSCMGLSMPTPCNTTPCIPSADLTTIQNWIMAGAGP